MADDRDYAGMYEIEPGVFVMRVHVYEDDARFKTLEARLASIEAKLNAGIRVQVVTSL